MLGRAKTMMRGWVAAAPAAAMPYNVACANGHRLRGNRTEGYQALRCPSCGEAVFILPRSPLPEPPIPSSTNRSRARSAADAWASDDSPHALVDPPEWTSSDSAPGPRPANARPGAVVVEASDQVAEIDWVYEVLPETPEAAAPTVPGSPVKKPAPTRPAARPRPTTPSPAVARTTVVELIPRATWREWASEHRNSLLAAGLVLVVLGAISVRRWRQRLEDLPRVAEIGRTEGFKKLDSGDFFAAKKILGDASAAVDAMGGRFEGADAIRQGAQEAAIFTDLVPRTLEELVEEAITFDPVGGWSAHFDSMYRGRSIVLETTITSVPTPDKPESRFEDAYRILVGRGPKPDVKARIDYQDFELFTLTKPKVNEIKLIGARLAALEYNRSENLWVFTLKSDSGVFMTHTQALEALHWPAGEPVEEAQP